MRRLAVAALFCAGGALAGERLTLAEKVAGADLILEVKVKGASPALEAASVERVVFPRDTEAPPLPDTLMVFSAASPCWKVAKAKGAVKALLFFKRTEAGALTQLVGVEGETGRYSDLHPAYPKLVQAVALAAGFTEERMRAVSAEMLWGKEKTALGMRENPYLMSLAAEFLRSHGAADVVDEKWGKPGTAERKKNEALAADPGPENVCRRK